MVDGERPSRSFRAQLSSITGTVTPVRGRCPSAGSMCTRNLRPYSSSVLGPHRPAVRASATAPPRRGAVGETARRAVLAPVHGPARPRATPQPRGASGSCGIGTVSCPRRPPPGRRWPPRTFTSCGRGLAWPGAICSGDPPGLLMPGHHGLLRRAHPTPQADSPQRTHPYRLVRSFF